MILGLVSHIASAEPVPTVHGHVRASDSGRPIPYTYVAITDDSFVTVGDGSTAPDGTFAIAVPKPVSTGYVMVQPPGTIGTGDIESYEHAPRIYSYAGQSALDIELPPVASIVLRAYGADGHLLRWEDFKKGGSIGDQFMYATDTNDCEVEATCWPVFDGEARKLGRPREKGLPALIVPPGTGYVPQVLFWDTLGYGKLQLRADNDGAGYSVKASQTVVVELNVELAATAVRALRDRFPDGAKPLADAWAEAKKNTDAVTRAAAADAVLAGALRLRDALELKRAREAITKKGPRADFSFGVFEGGPYQQQVFQVARDAGFNMVTLLLGWGWTDARGGAVDKTAIEQTFGIERLRRQGFSVKAHGVVWLQDYGILPGRAKVMNPREVCDAILLQEQALLGAYADRFAVWEAMNEPNVTNVVHAPAGLVSDLLGKSAVEIAKHDALTVLVNSAHEGDYGRKFAVYTLDNTPRNDWNRTYLAYLRNGAAQPALAQLDAIGLQYYPGFHFNETFGGLQGPATTPSYFVDLVARYAALGKPIHITEFSLPSSYGAGWTSGYWREPWTERTQADYAEAIFTLAYADPGVRSITWWDVTDRRSSVTTGGLCDASGKPKPVLDRLKSLIAGWTST